MRHVYTARDEMDAGFLRDLLVQQGIRAVVQGGPLEGGAFGNLPLSAQSMPTVWVADEDESKAVSIVDEYREVDRANADDSRAARATWRCANCGEQVERQFTQCWKCGHPQPAESSIIEPVDGPH
jgi:hypothetical protein